MPAHHRAFRDPKIMQRAAAIGSATVTLLKTQFDCVRVGFGAPSRARLQGSKMTERYLLAFMPRLVILMLAAANSDLCAQSLGSAFTYQGQLKELSQPASGLYDLEVCLFDGPSNPIAISCAPDFDDVPVEAGLFAITLDFGSAPFVGQQRFLELRVKPGASGGGYTILSPRQIVRPAPEALRSNVAAVAPWSGLTGMPSGFSDGTDDNSGGTVTNIATGAGLTGGPITGSGSIAIAPGGIGAAQINAAQVQSRISGSCAPGMFVRLVNQDGTVVCDPAGAGSITGVTAGTGLAGGGTSGSVTVSIAAAGVGATEINPAQVQSRVSGNCTVGQYVRAVNQDGTVTCVVDTNSGGSVTTIATGAGLTGGPITASGSIAVAQGGINSTLIDPTQVQVRVAGTCSVGQSITSIGVDGGVQCAGISSTPRQSVHAVPIAPTQYVSTASDPVGNPVIVTSSSSMNIFRCQNSACTTLPARSTLAVGASFPDVGVGSDGTIRVGFSSGSQVRFVKCSDLTCSSFSNMQISSGAGGHEYLLTWRGMALNSAGLAAFVARDSTDQTLMFRRCLDVQCSSLGPQQVIAGAPGITPSIAFRADGRPVIASAASTQVAITQCSDADCSSFTVNTFSNNGYYSDIVVPTDDRPIVAALTSGSANLYLHRCDSPACTSITTRLILASGATLVKPRIWISDQGLPVIAFGGAASGRWHVAACADMNCNGAGISNVALSYTSEADATVGADGYPFVAGQFNNGAGQELQVVKCYSSGCQ